MMANLHAHRQTDGHTERQTDTESHDGKPTRTQTDRQTYIQRDRQIQRAMMENLHAHIDRHTARQTDQRRIEKAGLCEWGREFQAPSRCQGRCQRHRGGEKKGRSFPPQLTRESGVVL